MKNESSNKTRSKEKTATELNTEIQKQKTEKEHTIKDDYATNPDYLCMIIKIISKIKNQKLLKRIYALAEYLFLYEDGE